MLQAKKRENNVNMATFQVKLQDQENFESFEIRQFTIDDEAISYIVLKERIKNIFNDVQGEQLEVFWVDDENDEVKISSDEELGHAVQCVNGQVVKMVVKTISKRHETCAVCPEFLLCEDCAINGSHNEHEVVRIEMDNNIPSFARASTAAGRGMAFAPRRCMLIPRPFMCQRGGMVNQGGRGGMFNPRGTIIHVHGRMPHFHRSNLCLRGGCSTMGPRVGMMGLRGDMMGPRGGMMGPPRGGMMGPRDEMGPRGGMMGPRGGMMRPPRRGMGPRGGMMGSRGGMMESRVGMMGPRGGMMGSRGGMMGPRDDMMEPRGGMMGLPRGGMMGPRDDMGPRGGMMGPRGGMMGPRDDMMEPRGDLMESRGGMMGPMEGMMGPLEDSGIPGNFVHGSPRFVVPCV